MLRLKIKCLNKKILNIYKNYLLTILKKGGFTYKIINLPTYKNRITLLKSPHVYKKAREQFQFDISKTIIDIKHASSNFIKYLILNKPSTVKVKIIRGIV